MFFSVLSANAADNVLQAVQVDGVSDTYNIILKSDDKTEIKKTIQAPNKMVIDLKGIRASKTINTIYSNTSSVDTVIVESVGKDDLKIFIQADNVSAAEITFDTLKTPLGVLNKPVKNDNQIVLNEPMTSYTPVYNEDSEEETGMNLTSVLASPQLTGVKKMLKDEKISWIISFGLFAIIVLSGIKAIKGNDNEIKVGLSQSLKERELDLRQTMANSVNSLRETPIAPSAPSVNYGLKAYQQGTRSPYMTAELPQRRAAAPQVPPVQQNSINVPRPSASAVVTAPVKKVNNIDSMKFLESMTQIYEKNGRADLAQGLKANINKARTRV